jgi:hypothetical protein
MRKKYGKFYADWRDEHGRRRMKAFPTKKQALTHTHKMQRSVAAKMPAPRQGRNLLPGVGRGTPPHQFRHPGERSPVFPNLSPNLNTSIDHL